MADLNTETRVGTSRFFGGAWIIWIILGLLAVVYIYASRTGPVAPAAFEWAHDADAALARAAANDQLVLVDFYATWCGPCRMMDDQVFSRDDVAQALADWQAVKIDVDRSPGVARRYGVSGVPTIVILSPRGEEITRTSGYVPADKFIDWIDRIEEHQADAARGE